MLAATPLPFGGLASPVSRDTRVQTATSDCPPAPAPCGHTADYTEVYDALYRWLAAVQAAETARRDAWEALHRCEQPDSWTVQGTFGNGLAGGGGLGISNGAWTEAGGEQYAPVPGMATPDQQIAVAEVILARHGAGAWGCPLGL